MAPPEEMPRPFACGLLSVAVPGAGQICAGRRRRGLLIIALALSAGVLASWYAWREEAALAESVVQLDVLLALLVANALALILRFVFVVDAYGIAARERRRAGGSSSPIVMGVSLVALLCLTVAPHALFGWITYVTYDTIDTVFADEEPRDVLSPEVLAAGALAAGGSAPVLAGDRAIVAEEADRKRRGGWTTILLIGGDAGYLREGLRADTLIAVSIQSGTGRAAVFSVPRNLERVPLVGAAGRAYGRFPDLINALYRFAHARPDLFRGGRDPGATALKQTVSNLLGIPIHYYVLVDLRGFVEVVDALGGVRLVATDTVDDLTSPAFPGEPWTEIHVEEGDVVRLDGRHTLAYARSRWASSDYSRMLRQRCVLAAMATRIDSMRVVRSLSRLSSAAKRFVSTDIPRKRLPKLVRLLRGISPYRTMAVSFSPPTYSVVEPDVAQFRSTVRRLQHFKLQRLREEDGLRAVAGLCPQP